MIEMAETLAMRVQTRGPRPLDEVVRMVARVARELGRAHVQKRGHGAVAPDVIEFLRRPRARVSRIELRAARSPRASLLWCAPEVAVAGHVRSPVADVWSLGLVAFYALTGTTYFSGEDPVELLRAILVAPLPKASVRAGERGIAYRLFEGFDGWFALCVARMPHERFPTAPRAAASLIARIRHGSPGALAMSPPTPPARFSRDGDLTVAV